MSQMDLEGGSKARSRKEGSLRLRTMSMSLRMEILASLQAFLQALLKLQGLLQPEEWGQHAAEQPGNDHDGDGADGPVCASWSADRPMQIQVYRKPASAHGGNSSRDAHWGQAATQWQGGLQQGGGAADRLSDFCDAMLPLLLQCWGECIPSAVDSRASLDAMRQLLRIFLLLATASAGRSGAAAHIGGAGPSRAMGAVCRTLMASFPVDGDRLPPSLGASPSDLAEINHVVCAVVTMGLQSACCTATESPVLRAQLLYMIRTQLDQAYSAAAAAGTAVPRGKGGKSSRGRSGGDGSRASWDAAARWLPQLRNLLRPNLVRLAAAPGVAPSPPSACAWAWGDDELAVLEALSACLEAAPAGSSFQRGAVNFLRHALRDYPHAAPPHAARWLAHAPRLLWTLSHRSAFSAPQLLYPPLTFIHPLL